MTTNSILKAVIAVDDLRVGGIQRLVMDEAYALTDQGYLVQILNFGAERNDDLIFHVDGMTKEKLQKKSISILNFPSAKLSKFRKLRHFLVFSGTSSVICHSPSTSLWLRLAAISSFRRIKISLWIHQVLTLSDFIQATKRVLFSMTADKIFFSAVQFKLEWESNLADKMICRFRKNQYRTIDRIGVYIPRVLRKNVGTECDLAIHLIYASRLTPWKGLEKFDKLIEKNSDIHPVIMTVNIPKNFTYSMLRAESIENHLLVCRSPNFIANLKNAVHIYPTEYGNKVQYPQSVGLNVMEFAVLGIPSLISLEAVSTYPEILNSILVEPVDWQDEELVQQKIRTLAQLTQSERKQAAKKLQSICSIESHLSTIKSSL